MAAEREFEFFGFRTNVRVSERASAGLGAS
jgi:hypothetical protein